MNIFQAVKSRFISRREPVQPAEIDRRERILLRTTLERCRSDGSHVVMFDERLLYRLNGNHRLTRLEERKYTIPRDGRYRLMVHTQFGAVEVGVEGGSLLVAGDIFTIKKGV